jgi:hypothetical protein
VKSTAVRNPITRPSTVLFGEIRGDRRRVPNQRPPRYAPVSPRNVPTSTSTTIPSPWSSPRRRIAWATAIPTQNMPSSVIAIPSVSVAPSRRGTTRPSRKISGSDATVTSSTCRSPPSSAATARPVSARKPASLTGRTGSYIRNSSCRQTKPSTRIPAAKIQPPATMIAIA